MSDISYPELPTYSPPPENFSSGRGIEGTVNPDLHVTPESLLSESMTSEYVPQAILGMYGYIGLMNRNRPPFTYWTVRDMLCDPRILFGLMLLKGPIVSSPSYEISCENGEVQDFLQKNLDRFWNVAASRVLKAIDWGYSASEILYRYDSLTGKILFDDVRDLEPLDTRPVVMRGNIVGFRFRNNPDPWGMTIAKYSGGKSEGSERSQEKKWGGWSYIGAPRALWHLHWRDRNPWFGLSRLFGAHVPWYEMWSEDGYRQIRRLWYTSCAFDGGIMYHPTGTVPSPTGPKPARDYAREMIEKKRTGATLTLPNQTTGDGSTQSWQYQPPQGNPTPAGLLEYGDDLRNEIFEALGVPPEVIQASGEAGFGSSGGRGVPQEAYYAILHELSSNLVRDFDRYCLRYLVAVNFGQVPYELRCNPIGSPQKNQEQPQGVPIDEQGNPLPPEAVQQDQGQALDAGQQ